jgi:hypothetical protein
MDAPQQAATPFAESSECPDALWTADGGRVALHGRRPLEEADRQLAGIVGGGWPTHLVVIGLGLGYGLDAGERVAGRDPRTTLLLPARMRRLVDDHVSDWAAEKLRARVLPLTGWWQRAFSNPTACTDGARGSAV